MSEPVILEGFPLNPTNSQKGKELPYGGRMVVECIHMVRWVGSRAGDCMVAMHIVTLLSLYFSPPCTATTCCYLNSWDERVRETHKKYQLKSALYMDCALLYALLTNCRKTIYKWYTFFGKPGDHTDSHEFYWSPACGVSLCLLIHAFFDVLKRHS